MARRRHELWWPAADERRLLARFYAAVGLSQALYLVYPFEFAYLYLAMRRPEWSVLPLMAASATALVGQLPTGALADRWSRKASVLLGGVLTAASFATVPWAVRLHGSGQLAGACAAFAVAGLGETLMAGAQEAWVVDNLHAAGRADLVEGFFARSFAVTAVGGVIGGTVAVSILLLARVDQALLDLLWYVTAAGFLAATAVAAGIAEHRVAEGDPASDPPGPGHDGSLAQGAATGTLLGRMTTAVRILVGRRTLLFLTLAVIVATLSAAAANEAFPVSLLTKDLDARLLAPLGIVSDLVGVVAPLLGLGLARRLGAEPVLAVTLLVAGGLVTALFASQAVLLVACLYVLLGFLDRMWDPVALARVQDEIPSTHRAAISSLVSQASGLAELGGLGLFAVLLGSDSGQLREATPDLVQAFSGHAHVRVAAPTGWFGLPLPDLGIVLFVLAGVAAVPFVLLAARARRTGRGPGSGATSLPGRGTKGRTTPARSGTDRHAFRDGPFPAHLEGTMRMVRRLSIPAAVLVGALVLVSCGSGGAGTADRGTVPGADPSVARLVPQRYRTAGTLTIAVDASYAPNEFFASDGRIVGMDVDLGKALATTMGLRSRVVNASFDSILPGLASGKYHLGISSFTDTRQREKTVDFVTYFKAGTSFFERSKAGPAIDGLASLCGLRVAVEKGTTQAEDAQAQSERCVATGKSPVTVEIFPDQGGANLALVAGRADVAMADSPLADYQVERSHGTLRIVGPTYGTAPYGIAMSKPSHLATAVLAGVHRLMATGRYQQILKRWGVGSGGISDPAINAATA